MPDIKTLGIFTVNCKTIEVKEADDTENCKTNHRQEIETTENTKETQMTQNLKLKTGPMVNDTDNNNIKYFLPGPNSNANKKASDEITKQLKRQFKGVFNGIRCLDGTFSLQVKPDSKPYQTPP